MAASKVERFGPYVIIDRIGDGGMAEIFLAKRQGYSGFEKLIALKKILPRYSQNPTFAEMLIQEAKLAACLQHHNVVQVYDLGEIEGQVYIAMEYVHGRDLAAVLSNTYRRKERLPLALSLCVATEFMTGLDYAHRIRNADGVPLRIIHRDISPQNILISYEGEVKVTDFGIARVLGSDGLKLPGNLHGKFGYMSPEQVTGQNIDQTSDIFSAGVVLYEILTGQRLFRGKDHRETARMVVSLAIPPPSAINPEVPPAVDRICEKALARDRDSRYLTMGALLGDLSRVADSLPQRAATRDLSVYMRRQFGNASGSFAVGIRSRGDSTSSSIVLLDSPGLETTLTVTDFAALSAPRAPLGQILIAHGAATAGDIEIALAEQRARGGRIGEILLASGCIGESDLLRALSTQAGVAVLNESELLSLPPPTKLLSRFPREAAEATMIVPISINETARSVGLALNDPYDDRAILETKVVLGVNDVVRYLAKRSAIRAAIGAWYAQPQAQAPITDPVFEIEAPEIEQIPAILIADSDEMAAHALRERISAEGCDVLVAHDGRQARAICLERKPMVIVLEAALPIIDGYNLLLEIRSRSDHAAVFMTSTRADEFHQAKALELGADDFIVKPFALELVTSKIRRELKRLAEGRRPHAPTGEFRGVSGSLRDMTAVDIVQSLELGRKSACVVLQYEDGRSGELCVVDGQVRGAISLDVRGEDAFFLLSRPGAGLFRIEYRIPSSAPNIHRPNTYLMIEAMRQFDASGEAEGPRAKLRAIPSLDAMSTLPEIALELRKPSMSPTPPSLTRASRDAGPLAALGPVEARTALGAPGSGNPPNLSDIAADLSLDMPRRGAEVGGGRPAAGRKRTSGEYSLTQEPQAVARLPLRRVEPVIESAPTKPEEKPNGDGGDGTVPRSDAS